MTLVYEHAPQSKSEIKLVDEYAQWQLKLSCSLFYPGKGQKTSVLELPVGLTTWAESIDVEKFGGKPLRNLLDMHESICAQAQALLAQASVRKEPPEYDTYMKFCEIFNEFMKRLGRLEREFISGAGEYDELTGLRSSKVLYWDIQRELDRLERDGKPFAVAMLQIDDFEKLQKNSQPQVLVDIIIKVSDMIKKSLRSFDDAYSLGSGVFILTLKQTESDGGVRALERLRKDLEKHSDEGIQLSSCIAEPVPEDDIPTLIQNLKSDLNSFEEEHEGSGSVMEYLELTPLQRYLKEQRSSKA